MTKLKPPVGRQGKERQSKGKEAGRYRMEEASKKGRKARSRVASKQASKERNWAVWVWVKVEEKACAHGADKPSSSWASCKIHTPDDGMGQLPPPPLPALPRGPTPATQPGPCPQSHGRQPGSPGLCRSPQPHGRKGKGQHITTPRHSVPASDAATPQACRRAPGLSPATIPVAPRGLP